MITVRDIYLHVLALSGNGLPPEEAANRASEMAPGTGFPMMGRVQTERTIRLDFRDGESIYFDGKDWHHWRRWPRP